MPTITIPKISRENDKLVAVPQKTYEEFLEWQRKMKSTRTFKPTRAELQEVERARKDFRNGKYIEWHKPKDELAHLHKK